MRSRPTAVGLDRGDEPEGASGTPEGAVAEMAGTPAAAGLSATPLRPHPAVMPAKASASTPAVLGRGVT